MLPHENILGVDMPGADSERRSFDIVFHGHSGEILHELNQVDMRDLPAWGNYMVCGLPHFRTLHDQDCHGFKHCSVQRST